MNKNSEKLARLREAHQKYVEAAVDLAVSAAIEKCAQIAEKAGERTYPCDQTTEVYGQAAVHIAAAIRSGK